jgi:hypothetical protein
MTTQIQAEIRVADILEMYKQRDGNFYICYVVALMLKEQIEKIPGFQEFRHDYYGDETALYYSFLLTKKAAGRFCDTVVQYFNMHIEKHFPNAHLYPSSFFIHTLVWYKSESDVRLGFIEWNRVTRMGMMERILNDDPEAVITINVGVYE